jgi:hypothetical protein
MILCTAYMIAQAQGWPEYRERLSTRNGGRYLVHGTQVSS